MSFIVVLMCEMLVHKVKVLEILICRYALISFNITHQPVAAIKVYCILFYKAI